MRDETVAVRVTGAGALCITLGNETLDLVPPNEGATEVCETGVIGEGWDTFKLFPGNLGAMLAVCA